MTLPAALAGKRVCVCLGAGGVGKTTVAAAVGLGLAAAGHRTVVVTIDPARRLADALGLHDLDDQPRPVDTRPFGVDVTGELWAMMLDPKRAIDDLIDRLSPDRGVREAILGNRVYGELSTAVAGSQEFGAVAKLNELSRSGRFDVIVLDTPPSRNALDFLNAPGHLAPLLQHRVMRAFTAPTGFVLAALRRLTGAALLHDVAELFGALGAVADGMARQSADVDRLLRDPATAFLLVTAPERLPVDEALFLADRLRAFGPGLSAVVVNRVHARARARASTDATGLDGELAAKALRSLEQLRRLADRDAREVERLSAVLHVPRPVVVPDFARELQDAEGLAVMHRHLFASRAEAARLLDHAAF